MARPPFDNCSSLTTNGLYVELVFLTTVLRIPEVLDSLSSLPRKYQDRELPPK